MKEQINEIIIKILEERELANQDNIIESSTKLRDDLGLDSLGLAMLTVHIEDEFDVDIFEEGIISTVGEIYMMIEK